MEAFIPFRKIPRLSRDCVITEKIDGTNGVIYVSESGEVIAGSRTRWITPEKDNFGFAKWVETNKEELKGLGIGLHYGEWWGPGIQRGYGVKEKTFSLFNTERWFDNSIRPKCCSVVPILYIGPFDTKYIEATLTELAIYGSKASPGFMRPEGIVIYHKASGCLFKKTVENDEKPKGA